MLIVCPNCQTHYSVDRKGFEPSGRTVRCSNCGNSWRQGPVADPPPGWTAQPQPAYAPPPQQQAYAPPPGYPPYPPPGYPYPPPGYPPPPQDTPGAAAAAQAAAVPEPSPAPEPAPPPIDSDDDDDVVEPNFDLPDPEEEDDLEDGITANIDAMFGDDDDDYDDADSTPAADDDADNDDDLSEDEIEGLFDDDSSEGSISSMIDDGSAESGSDGYDDLDDIPEPDPLPESLTGGLDDDDEDGDEDTPPRRAGRRQAKKKSGKGGLIAIIVILVLLLGTGVAGFFARSVIVELVPQTQVVYDMIGLDTGVLGDGLEIQDVKSSRATEAGVDILVVSGTIANIEEESHDVPLVQAVLLDGEGVEMQVVVQEPPADNLPAGAAMEFQIRIEEPSPLSRRLEVTFAPRPEPGQ